MPSKMAEFSSLLGSVNTTGFLFGDEDDHNHTRVQNKTASPDAKTYLQLHTNDDKFPILVRREGEGMQLSASSAAMDLASAQYGGSDNQPTTDRATASRNKQSNSPNTLRHPGVGEAPMSPRNGILTDLNSTKNTPANKRSLEVKFTGLASAKRPGLLPSPNPVGANGVHKVQGSYSTNDIPTLKSTNATEISDNSGAVQSPRINFISPARQTSTLNSFQNGFHTPARQTEESTSDHIKADERNGGSLAQRSALQASAAPFGPSMTSAISNGATHTGIPPMQPYDSSGYYGGYGPQMLNHGFNNMYIGHQSAQWNGQAGAMPSYQNGFGNAYPQQYTQHGPARFNDSQSRTIQQRRTQNGDGTC